MQQHLDRLQRIPREGEGDTGRKVQCVGEGGGESVDVLDDLPEAVSSK